MVKRKRYDFLNDEKKTAAFLNISYRSWYGFNRGTEESFFKKYGELYDKQPDKLKLILDKYFPNLRKDVKKDPNDFFPDYVHQRVERLLGKKEEIQLPDYVERRLERLEKKGEVKLPIYLEKRLEALERKIQKKSKTKE